MNSGLHPSRSVCPSTRHVAKFAMMLACVSSPCGCEWVVAADEDIPVTIQSNQLIEVERPDKIVVHRDADMYQQAIRDLVANRREFEGIPDSKILALLLEDPTLFIVHDEQHKRVALNFKEQFQSQSAEWLVPQRTFQDVLKVAQLLAAGKDRTGFDFLVKRLDYPEKDDLYRLCVGSHLFPADWLASSPAIKAAMNHLLEDPSGRPHAINVLARMGDKQPAIDYWHDQYRAHKDNLIYRGSALRSLAANELSAEVLDMLEETLTYPATASFYHGPGILRTFIESGDQELSDRAAKLCQTLAASDSGYAYHILLCELGGVEYADYFFESVKERSKRDYSLNALFRVLPGKRVLELAKKQRAYTLVVEHAGTDAIEYLRDELKAQSKSQVTSLRIAKLLTPLLDGAPDPESAAVLRKIVPKVYDHLNGRKMIEQMVLMGATDGPALQAKLRKPNYSPLHTDKHWELHRVTQQDFVDFLNTAAGGKSITVQQARDESDFQFTTWRARPFASMAMQASGIGRQFELDMVPFEALPTLTAQYCQLTGGELQPDGVSLVAEDFLRIAWKDRVFEFVVDDNCTWYDPVTHTDMLNLMLENAGQTSKRFFVFDTDLDSQIYHVAFLDPKVARQLVDKYRLVIIREHDNL